MSDFYLLTRAAYAKVSKPVAKAALRAGLTPDVVTILGTAGSVVAALTLFPIGQLWWGAFAVFVFVLADMLDGAMARERGFATRFGGVLDATCDRIADGAIFCGLLWWAAFGLHRTPLVVAIMICLVTSQVISYVKARAEANGLTGDGGMIERPERLIIALLGAGLSGVSFLHVPWLLDVSMWLLAVASLITLGQRVHSVRVSPGAMEPLRNRRAAACRLRGNERAVSTPSAGLPRMRGIRVPLGGQLTDLGYAAGWRLVRAMPEFAARNTFDAGALYASRGGGPEQLRKNLARIVGVPPDEVPGNLIRASLASYARYWREAFRLPSMDHRLLAQRLNDAVQGSENIAAALDAGRGAVMALPHSGNWDMSGVWLTNTYGEFATVAERLKPESLYKRFVDYRVSLGFEVLPLTGGAPPFEILSERLRGNGLVCLMSDRDLTRSGVQVDFFGEATRLPAGPANLALATGAALLPAHSWFEPDVAATRIHPPLDTSSGDVALITQALADQFAANIAEHPADWHMMQPQWVADLSDERRRRLAGGRDTGSVGAS